MSVPVATYEVTTRKRSCGDTSQETRAPEQRDSANKRGRGNGDFSIKTGASVLESKVDLSNFYRPRSQKTAGVYKEILAVIQNLLVGESSGTLCEAAHEILLIHKADDSDQVRKKKLAEILPHSSITDDLCSTLFRLCGMITDFVREEDSKLSVAAGATGIAVTFDEDDEDKQEEYEAEIDDDGSNETFGPSARAEDEESKLEDVEESKPVSSEANPNEIPWSQFQEGSWLKRELVHLGYSGDDVVSMEQAILDSLQLSNMSNNSLIENRLFQLFKFKNLSLCKLIVYNRYKLWFAKSVLADPTMRENLSSQLLEQTDSRASDFYRELSCLERPVDADESKFSAAKFPQPSCLLDLSSLMFSQGARLMTNPTFVPQTKTLQVSKKSYDEVHVQAAEKVQVRGSDLVPVKSALPKWMHVAFAGFDRLNPIQSKVFPIAFNEFDENILMCAPTGAGKTNVAMLAIMNVLKQYWNESKEQLEYSNFKIVYIAPMKALVQEVVKSFSVRLNPLGLNVRELSGDVSISRELMADTHVIVTTPEKWDVVTRKGGEAKSFTQLVRLVIIDEVHLLHDSRGPVLEALVARIIRQIEQTHEFVRIVALSATLPNFRDVALFLRVNLDKGLFYFGSEYRPVPLEQTYVGITSQKGLKRAQVTNEVLFEKVMEDAGKNQILVFVHGRKETVRTARELRSLAVDKKEEAKFIQDTASRGILEHEAGSRASPDLKDLLPFGIGVHHAGLSAEDRSTVEDLFAARHLSLVVCTLTLAWGVNLPAHTVIIKGTQIYVPEKGDWVELSPMDMMQMMGRAGRPQYDTSGHGIIITNKSELQYHLSLNNMQLPIESQLISVLPDMINAELALGSISTRDEAAKWLGYTYLFVRMMQNPTLYGVPADESKRDPKLVQRRVDLAHAALTQLDKNGLCKYDRRSGSAQITALGRVASYFYLRSESVCVYNQHLKPNMSDMDLLRLFSLSREFKYIPVREEEKVELMKLVELVPIPVKGGAEDACSKINVLLQAYISRLSLDGFALMADMVFVRQNAGRLFRALFEIALRRGWCVLARKCLVWCKLVELRMWPIQTVLRQFPSVVPEDICRKIERKGLSNEEFSLLNAEEIGQVIRNTKLGRQIASLFSDSLPKMNVTAYVQPLTRSTLLVKVDLTADFEFDPAFHNQFEFFWLFVEDVSQQHCLFADQFSVNAFQVRAKSVQTITLTVPITEPVPPFYFIRLVSDRWLLSDTLRPVSFRHLVLPEKNLPLTELQDREPLPVSACTFGEELLRKWGVEYFNPMQSQLFDPIFKSDNNLMLCAPLSSGKSICIDLAILRVLDRKRGQKCIYMTPNEGLAKLKLRELRGKFSNQQERFIVILTGEPGQDLKIMEASDIIVSTPFPLDLISRKWRTKRTRRLMESTALFITDNLHLLDTQEGAVQEIVTSRMRYIAGAIEKDNRIRLIGCASAVSNAHDLASWIGASPSNVFSFGSSVRSIPLEVVMHGLDIFNRSVRQSALLRPFYSHINKNTGSGTVIAFCTSRKHVRSAAAELALLAAGDGKPFRFLSGNDSVVKEYAASMREKSLASSLERGIGYLHSGMCEEDKLAVLSLYRNGAIQVLLVSFELMWGLGLKASLVAILDTSVLNVSEQQYVDYRALEVQEMLSMAGRPGLDEFGKCVLFCANAKREFYKRFIHVPLNVESVVDESLADHLNAEISNSTIKSRQDCIDWLTWTLFYRRITKNPNYYSLAGTGHQAVSDFLSALVEDNVDLLIESGMIVSSDAEDSLSAGDLGLVASYYNVKTSTIEMFKRSVSKTSKRKHLIELISQATEFASIIASSASEEAEKVLTSIAASLNQSSAGGKVHLLLHAHFNRIQLPIDLQSDLEIILPIAHRLVLALVDVVSTCGFLKTALAAMEIAPMVVQGCVPSASPLLQLPYFDTERCEEARGTFEIEDVVDILAMEENDRFQLLSGLTESQISEVAKACNMYPSISMGWKKEDSESLAITLDREGELVLDKRGSFVPVYAPRYPKQKEEAWWLVLGTEEGEISDLKRITISQAKETVLMRVPSDSESSSNLKLFLMSDSFIGCDQEEEVIGMS